MDPTLDSLLRYCAQHPNDIAGRNAVADRLAELGGPYVETDTERWTGDDPIVFLDPILVAEEDSPSFAGLRDAAEAKGDRHVFYAGVLYLWTEI